MAEQNRTPRKVGVYDRPAGADRPPLARRLVYVLVVVALIASLYFFLWRASDAHTAPRAAWIDTPEADTPYPPSGSHVPSADRTNRLPPRSS
jgi:hypothetical protein